jgi:hypothetical protein
MTREDLKQWCSSHDPPGGAFRVPGVGAADPKYYCCECVLSWPTDDLMRFENLGPDPDSFECLADLLCATGGCGRSLQGRLVVMLEPV